MVRVSGAGNRWSGESRREASERLKLRLGGGVFIL